MSAVEQAVASAMQPPPAARETTIQALKPADPANLPVQYVGFESLQAFETLQRIAKMFASSSIVPQRYQNNVANCAIAIELAIRLRAAPLLVMQNLYIVYGMPAWAAKFLIACFNQCGRFTSIDYAFEGTPGKDDWGCRAWATELATGQKKIGPLITIKLAKDEGWYNRKDRDGKVASKWPTMPEQMLRYRSAAWFINTTAPEISMGLPTEDEARDIYDATRGADGVFTVTTESLRQAENGNKPQLPALEGTTTSPMETAAALDLIKNAQTIGELEASWSSIVQNFQESKRDFPPELQPARDDRRAAIEQKL